MGKITIKKGNKDLPLQAWPSISYKSHKAKKTFNASVLADNIESFTYTDVASGESDSVDITLCNADKIWMGKRLPLKGDTLSATIKAQNWAAAGKTYIIDCGTFCCDNRSFDFPEAGTATISGVSVPENSSFRATQNNKTWTNITIREIARQIAKKHKMKLSYSGPQVKISKAEQNDADDCSFLNSICDDYGFALKVYRGKIVIYDIALFEKKPAVATINYADVIDGSYNSTLVGTYTGAKIKYKVGENEEKTLTIGSAKRMLNISDVADTRSEADRKARSKLKEENRKAETLKITVSAVGKKLWAASVIMLKGASTMSGRWFIDKATHTISASDGYSIALEMHRAKK